MIRNDHWSITMDQRKRISRMLLLLLLLLLLLFLLSPLTLSLSTYDVESTRYRFGLFYVSLT